MDKISRNEVKTALYRPYKDRTVTVLEPHCNRTGTILGLYWTPPVTVPATVTVLELNCYHTGTILVP